LIKFEHKIKNPNGIHVRPAGYLAAFAEKRSDSYITLCRKSCFDNETRKDNENVMRVGINASKVLSVIALGLQYDEIITFVIKGPDEKGELAIKNEICKILREHF